MTRREHEFPCSVCLLESDRPRLQRQILALWFLWCAFYAALRCVGVTSRAHVQRITACYSPIEPRHWLRLLLLLLLSPHVHGMETEPATARLEPLEAALAALMATVAALATLAPEHVRSSLQEVETRLGTIAAVVTSPHGSTYGSTPSSSSSDMSSDGGTSAPAETRVSPGTALPATGSLCFGERYECTRIRCHMPVALSQALCRYETRCGFLPHLAHCSTLIVHGCPASGSSSSLQIGGRLAQSAYVAPTTKGAERAATVSKCVANNGFDCNNNG